MADIVMVQIRFKVQTAYGEFNDALYYTEAEYAALSEADIETAKQVRINAWITGRENPAPYTEPTQEEWRKYYNDIQTDADKIKENIVYTKEELKTEKTELEAKLVQINEDIANKEM